MTRIALHHADTPSEAFARAVRHGAFAMAARIAHDYGLGRDLLILVLDRAICRFEELGFPEAAVAIAAQCGFTMVTVTPDQLAAIADGIEGSPETERPGEPRFLN